jgi:serine/threonine-protein kinase
LLVGDVLADRYELEELAGSGGMSTVFRARDRVLGRSVAVKILHQRYNDEDEYVNRFRREAQMAAGLQHHNIVTVFERGEFEGRQYIVFEYVDGDNLKEVVDREGPLPVERVLTLGIQIATALAFAHQSGLVHRDVKPQNVLLNGDGTAKVTDFGIARSLDVGKGVTQTGTVLGTSDYIAPEQAQGQSVGERTDVYSLGVVLYELLTGELPFKGDNFVAIAMKHINEPAPRASARRRDVPQRLDDAVAIALAKDPEARFARMDEFRRELQACLAEVHSGIAVTASDEHSDTVVIAPGPTTRRRRRGVARPLLLIVLGLALLGAVAWLGVETLVPSSGHGGPNGGGGGGSTSGVAISLQGTTAWDPYGTPPKEEHNGDAPKATDGDQATYWPTETYRSFTKPGVGLVLDAGETVSLNRLKVTTDTPGFTARIQAGSSSTGPFEDVSAEQTVGAETTFDLGGARGRYFVVWITSMPPGGSAHVNEVTAS